MNDAIREKLSAYLDGALSETESRAVELEVSRSEEMRLELEALRAVSAAVKGLPKEKLPAGFMARLEARRAREGAKPEREYFILPPSYRPLAFALSTAVVALVIWDRSVPHKELYAPHVGWDSDKVSVKSAADAPPSIDVSAQLSALDGRASGLDDEPSGNAAKAATSELTARCAKKEDAAGFKAGGPSTFGKNMSAPGKPLEVSEADSLASVGGALSGAGGAGLSPSATASGRGTSSPYGSVAAARGAAPARAQFEPAEGKTHALSARNEEERSAINERLYKGFEEEKKRMGITKIMDKGGEEENLPSGRRFAEGESYMALQASHEPPRLDRSRSAAAVRGLSKAKNSAPIVKAIALKSAEALSAAWAASGLPDEPPAVNFSEQMAIFLAGPTGCGIVDVKIRKNTILVLYKSEGLDDPSARVRAVALSPKPVVVKLAQ